MEIRAATEYDIPPIVDLLKQSLGEDLIPKSEAYWRWKHVENPFGPSPVLVAYDGSKLVGVRAFMRWQWKYGNRFFEAVRAVDTATHPEYQGRGIFKKLTLALLDYCNQEGWHFVFNTPNNNSKPGYLKMGWREAGKLPVHIQLVRPFSMALNLAGLKKKQAYETDDKSVETYLQHKDIPALLQRSQERSRDHVVTAHTVSSLLWRYRDVTVAQYFAAAIQSGEALNALMFYRIKPSVAGNELRITDIFMNSDTHKKEMYELVQEKAKLHRADYVTISGINPWLNGTGILSLKKLRIGPMVTIRNITFDAGGILPDFQVWSPSVGDLELF